mmetsp:Transcript_16134/g.32648  ORF Transcript_16134/g.32648 Transcript_16134/m.32648 type:complete len:480 (-) Transcript_16134:495-1934(-)
MEGQKEMIQMDVDFVVVGFVESLGWNLGDLMKKDIGHSSRCRVIVRSSVSDNGKGGHSSMQTSGKGEPWRRYREATRVVKGGYRPDEWTTDPYGRSVVNPPVYHASTVVFPTVDSLRAAAADWPFTGLWYGRHGSPTTFALEEAFATIEGGDNACVAASGVSAVNAALLAFLRAGDHLLMTDAVYDPTRSFCDRFLQRFQVETTYYSPTASADEIRSLIRDNTKVIFVESPGSLSFEVMDIRAISAVAHQRGVKVIMDNTYGPTLFKPFDNGVDVSINAATKYIGGHSDIMMGIIATSRETYRDVKKSIAMLGCPPGPDDAYLALRGLRTLSVRLKQHGENGLALAKWLETRPEVARVMHPALPSHPQHELFQRDFAGPAGLFSFQLREYPTHAVNALVDGMELFSIGFSWGGFESLILPIDINSVRSVDKWQYGDGYGATIRLHAGLEDVADLMEDLERGFTRLNEASEAGAAAYSSP